MLTLKKLLTLAILSSALSAFAADNDLLFHAPFDGALKADTAGGRGTPGKTPAEVRYVKGVRGQALLLKKDGVFYDRRKNINLSSGTIMFWMKPLGWEPAKKTETYEWIFAVAGIGAEGDRIQFFKYPTHQFVFYMGKHKNEKLLGNYARDWKADQWRFYALVWNDKTMKLFIDGKLEGKVAITEDNIAVDTGNVMRLQSSTNPIAYDEMRIFGRPLLDDEIAAYYLQDLPAQEAPASAAATLRPFVVIPKVAKPPHIDGYVNEKNGEWAHSSLISGFLNIPELLLSERQTELRMCYDDDNLFLLFSSPLSDKSVTRVPKHDGPVWSDTSNEILFATSPEAGARVSQLIFNARDVHFDQRDGDASWNPKWISRSKVKNGTWIAEVQIPFSEIGVLPPRVGYKWQFNFGHNFKNPDKFSNPIFALAYAELKSFWTVEFGSELDYVDIAFTADEAARAAGASGTVSAAPADKLVATFELKKAKEDIINRRKIPAFDLIEGETLFQKEFAAKSGDLPLKIDFSETIANEGEYFLRASVTDGRRPLLSQVFPFRIKERFTVELRPLSKDDKLAVNWELKSALGSELEVISSLLDSSGKQIMSKSARFTDKTSGELLFDMASLDQLDYKVVTIIKGDGGEFSRDSDFKCFKNAAWIGFSKKLADRHLVPAPWIPVEITAVGVRTLMQNYIFGQSPFPEDIKAKDESITAAPVTLTMETSASPFVPSADRKWLEKYPDKVSFTQTLTAQDAMATVQASFEFDGMTRFDVTITPKAENTHLDKMILEIPIKAAFATLKYPYRSTYQTWSVLDLEGEVNDYYKEYFTPHIWVGNDEKGIAWFAESNEHYEVAEVDKVIELVKKDGLAILRITMVDRPKPISAPVTYTFGIQATPTRPMFMDNWFALRYGSSISSKNLHISTGYSTGDKYHVKAGVPWPAIDGQRARQWAESVHAKPGRYALVYATSNGMGGNIPEFIFFEQEWKNPKVCDTWTFASKGYYHWGTCPTVETLRDFFLYSTAQAIEEYGIDGLYYDFGSTQRAANLKAGCGYMKGGELHATWPIFADREMRKMIYQLFMDERGHAYFVLHNYSQMIAPITSFMTLHLDGESYQQRLGKVGALITRDYTKLISVPRLRAMFGTQFGTVPYFLPELAGTAEDYSAPWMKPATRTLIALMLPHGIPIWGFYCDIDELNKYVSAQDKFRFEESDFTPYYKMTGELKTEPAMPETELLVSYWKKPDDLLVVVGNITDKPFSGFLIVDTAKLFPESGKKLIAFDAYDEKEFPVQGNRITLSVKEKDYALLRIKTKKE